jgi:hypothetical protein
MRHPSFDVQVFRSGEAAGTTPITARDGLLKPLLSLNPPAGSGCSAATTSRSTRNAKPHTTLRPQHATQALSIAISDPLPLDRIAEAHDRVDAGARQRVLLEIPG